MEWSNKDPRLTDDVEHVIICRRNDLGREETKYFSIAAEIVSKWTVKGYVYDIYLDSEFVNCIDHTFAWPSNWYWIEAP